MHETIETTALADHDHPPAKSGKVCVACGKDVAGQKRFKDAQGRYWCYDCGVDDHVRKTEAAEAQLERTEHGSAGHHAGRDSGDGAARDSGGTAVPGG